jgi:hypothetical protein
MSRKELLLLTLRALRRRGWSVDGLNGSGHRRLVSPSGHVLTCPSTPSDRRGGKNLLADIRRIERGEAA